MSPLKDSIDRYKMESAQTSDLPLRQSPGRCSFSEVAANSVGCGNGFSHARRLARPENAVNQITGRENHAAKLPRIKP